MNKVLAINVDDVTIGTFGHAGNGNLHPTILCDSPCDRVRIDSRVRAGA